MKGVFIPPESELKSGPASTRNLSADLRQFMVNNTSINKPPPAIRCSNNASPTTHVPDDCLTIMN